VNPEVAELREEVEAQKRSIAELEARVARTEPPHPSPFTSFAQQIVLSGYLHLDWVPYRQSSQDEVNPSTGDPLNEDRFVVRRARIRAESDQGLVHAAFMIDVNTVHGPQVRPWNAEASLKWPPKRLTSDLPRSRSRRRRAPS
jgi:hypothetical protein